MLLTLATKISFMNEIDFKKIKTQLKTPIIFDGRNQYSTLNLREKGIEYYQIGKKKHEK